MKTYLRKAVWICVLASLFVGTAWAGDYGAGAEGGDAPMTHRMMVLAVQLGVILFVAKLCSGLFVKMKLPGLLGEIFGGILAGPYLLGALPLPALPNGMFPVNGSFPISPELYGFCSVAAIVLLFDTGLETNVAMFMRYSLAGSLVGLGGVLLSFILGDFAAVWFSGFILDEPLNFLSPEALFLGVMSTATSVGITARLLSEKGKIDSPEGVTIMAGAVIDDVIGIILLAITMGMITASHATGATDWGAIGVIAAKAIGIWLVATTIGLAASHKISAVLKIFKDGRSIAIMALGLALILAGTFEQAGLAMIIGAYVMGLSLSRTDISHLIREKLEPVAAFLVPIFFVVMGMLVDIRLIASPFILIFGVIYTVFAIVAKVAGCAVPAMLCGFNVRGAMRVGVGMLPRGEVALIIAGIGLSTGVVGREVFGVGVFMTLITTVLAPPLLLGLLKRETSGLRHPVTADREEPMRYSFPSSDAVDILTSKIVPAFKEDGFFVHALDRSAGIYQMRKGESVIVMRHDGLDIVFDCSDQDRVFVQTVVLEVVSDLRRMATELAKPIEQSKLTEKALLNDRAPRSPNLFASYLGATVLKPELSGTTKSEIIEELVHLAACTGRIQDVHAALAAVLEREDAGSTGMQNGVAIPHGITTSVRQIVCAVGLKREGVDFDSFDGEPSRIFVLVLSPKDLTGGYLRVLATISQTLNEQGRAALLKCRTAEQMYACISSEGAQARNVSNA